MQIGSSQDRYCSSCGRPFHGQQRIERDQFGGARHPECCDGGIKSPLAQTDGIDMKSVMFWLKDSLNAGRGDVRFFWNDKGVLEMHAGGVRRATFSRVGGSTIDCR